MSSALDIRAGRTTTTQALVQAEAHPTMLSPLVELSCLHISANGQSPDMQSAAAAMSQPAAVAAIGVNANATLRSMNISIRITELFNASNWVLAIQFGDMFQLVMLRRNTPNVAHVAPT